MSKQIPSYLKLISETPPAERRANEDLAPLAEVCEAFARVTGLKLDYVEANAPCQPNLKWSAPVNPGVGVPPGLIRLLGFSEDASAAAFDRNPTKLADAKKLASAIGGLWQELLQTRQALWEREAELAVSVPVIEHRDEARQLATRLEAVLRGGAEAVGCHAAALYLLDDATSELKLRSSWGLPRRKLVQEPRPLCSQLADLEAMLGHAVVLDDPTMFGLWRVPEECASCVCVPISSPTMPLGTLWVFSHEPRGFSDTDTNMIEVVAGRIAADLEREMLLAEAGRLKRENAPVAETPPAAQELEEQSAPPRIRVKPSLPSTVPLIEGWQVAAGVLPNEAAGGSFFDWFQRRDGSLAVVAGCVTGRDGQPAVAAAQLRAAARVLGPDGRPANQLIERAGNLLWTNSSGDLSAGLMQTYLWPNQSGLEIASGGAIQALRVSSDNYDVIAKPTMPALGMAECGVILPQKHAIGGRDLIVSYAVTQTYPESKDWMSDVNSALAKSLAPVCKAPVEKLLELAHETLARTLNSKRRRDRVVLIIRRG